MTPARFILRGLLKSLAVLWASPYSLFGVLVGACGLATGGRARFVAGALEFHGGATKWFLHRLPLGEYTLAITFGHVILGQTEASLDVSRDHERVHVRQYERWGPLFGPAYLFCSFVLWLRGGDPYRDNPFEREAFEIDER